MLQPLVLAFFLLGQAKGPLTLRERAALTLMRPGVRRELKITPQQAAALDRAYPQVGTVPPPVERSRAFAVQANATLSEAQREALFRREVRAAGVEALSDDEVAGRIGLRGDDLKRIRIELREMGRRDVTDSETRPKATTLGTVTVRGKGRARARKAEEGALLQSLPPTVRDAWTALRG